MTYISNYKESIKTDAGEFLIEQRNVGFADNDGQWIVNHLPELYWSSIGTLQQRRPGAFLGVFANRTAVDVAVASAQLQPEQHRAVDSMGRVSC